MGTVTDDILEYYPWLATMPGLIADIPKDELMHYGTKRHSGRYPWGSGEDPYQHSDDFIARVEELRAIPDLTYTDPKTGKEYHGDTAVAKTLGLSTSQFRTQIAVAKDERRMLKVEQAKSLREHGYSTTEIANKMGIPESSVRSLFNAKSESAMIVSKNLADELQKQVDKYGMIDVGTGVDAQLNVSKEKLQQALDILDSRGYPTYGGRVPQNNGSNQMTTMKILCPPDTPHKDIFQYDKIHIIDDVTSHDGGDTFEKSFVYPASMDSKRLMIRYNEEGGLLKDGDMEIRRNVPDLDLGGSHYAQVRIMVDGDRYLKGMATYGDDKDFPPGVDVIFNTNKPKGTPMRDVLKEVKRDKDGNIQQDNPFGSLIKSGVDEPGDQIREGGQSYYIDPKDGQRKLSLINKRANEGDWGEWSKETPSQMLSKQKYETAKKQLDIAEQLKRDELNDILELTNPVVKRAMLQDFANDCDSSAVHLKAAGFPRQRYQVILPDNSLKDNEIYAPNFHDGETVALIRFPHGSTSEIPILKVNNKNKEGRSTIGTDALDAVGINHKNADRLSGADFDGDTVLVIPCNSPYTKTRITSTPQLEGLVGFDPKVQYGGGKKVRHIDDGSKDGSDIYERDGHEYKIMKDTQKQMGVISNLITDMTIMGATDDEKAAAIRHSMVVIDAEKHKLDWKQSEKDNHIKELKRKYQGHIDPETGKYKEGASTLISRASGEKAVLKRQGDPIINKETGELSYKTSDRLYWTDRQGKVHGPRTQMSTQMAETKDARTLISPGHHAIEELYASYANSMKAMANEARKSQFTAGHIKYDPKAAEIYKDEVKSLDDKLVAAKMNKPRERQAQRIASAKIEAMKKADPEFRNNKKEIGKAQQREIVQARLMTGAKRTPIIPTEKEWEAIQAGAISETKLWEIVANTDKDRLRELATPKKQIEVSPAKVSRINQLRAMGYTTQEIADAVGYSASTVEKYMKNNR